jgi:hypothetical protein
MYDEIYCHAALPDGDDPPGMCFQTKSFPDPCMFRYRITSEGRLIDSAGNDLEPADTSRFIRRIGQTATVRQLEEFRACGSIAPDFHPDCSRISFALRTTMRIASVTDWRRFDGSTRVRFSSTIRTKSPIRARVTFGGESESRTSPKGPRVRQEV